MTVIAAIIDYIFVVGVVQFVASAAWLLCAAGLISTRGSQWFAAHASRVVVFNALLFAWGLVLSSACHAATWGRYYVSHDFVLDWQPFVPFGPWVLQQSLGGETGYLTHGSSMAALQTLWWVSAIAVWVGAAFTFSRFTRAMSGQTY